MREKGQTEAAKTLETPVFSRGIEILTEKNEFVFLYIRSRTAASSGILGIPPDCVVEMLAAVQAN